MLKSLLICLLIIMVAVPLSGCASPEGEKTEGEPATEFGRMLDSVPYSFLEKYDIFYGNLYKAKELYGLEDYAYETLPEATQRLPFEKARQFWYDHAAALDSFPHLQNTEQLIQLIGFDVLSLDRTVVINNIMPRVSCIIRGNFDDEFIAGKLTELGYKKTKYGSSSYYNYYYEILGDYEIDIRAPLGNIVLSTFNRVAVFDDLIVISPATEYIIGFLGTMIGTTASILDNTICRILADSLGDPLAAAITTPERIITSVEDEENRAVFHFTVPASWKQLHTYEMAALGYRAEGDGRFFDIALYYKDREAAEADSKEIITRMSSYTLNTWTETIERIAFTDMYQPGEPAVTQYAEGAVLKISYQLLPEKDLKWFLTVSGEGEPMRDLLFLAPDPSLYILKE